METYVIFRRNGWRTAEELQEAARRSTIEGDRMAEESAGSAATSSRRRTGLGTVCIYQASSPEAIRRHAYASTLPVDEIVAVATRSSCEPTRRRCRRDRASERMSRRYGGIHFEQGDLDARATGRIAARRAWSKAQEYWEGR